MIFLNANKNKIESIVDNRSPIALMTALSIRSVLDTALTYLKNWIQGTKEGQSSNDDAVSSGGLTGISSWTSSAGSK